MSSEKNDKKRIDVDAATSEKTGLGGFFETFLRRFRMASYVIALIPLYLIGIFGMGLSATPSVYLFIFVTQQTVNFMTPLHYLLTACALVAGYFLYGIVLIFVMPLFNFLMPFRLKPFRGGYYSLETVPWYFHNAFTYIVRYTFLEFVTPTPLNMLFYRMMGMKIGKGSHINTTNISDPCIIELGDKVTIGGSVHIIGHYASKGFLIVEKVKIEDNVTIGLKATIMGGVTIGKGAAVGPHEVILPKTVVPAGRKPFETIAIEPRVEKDRPSQDFL